MSQIVLWIKIKDVDCRFNIDKFDARILKRNIKSKREWKKCVWEREKERDI